MESVCKVDQFAELIRTVVRPIITVSGWATYLVLVLDGKPIPEHFDKVIAGFTAWWFLDRMLSKRSG